MQHECDGSAYRDTRNCSAPARWLLRNAQEDGPFQIYACDRHLAQVARALLYGEQGDAEIRSIWTDE